MSFLDKNEIKGAIFDMDGVLLDTEILYQRFWCEAGRKFGYPFEPEHVLRLRSLTGIFAVQVLEEMFGVGFRYEEVKALRKELMEEYITNNGINTKSGAKDILESLRNKGIKICLATSSERNRAMRYLEKVGLLEYFDDFVCGGEAKQGKPKPDIYELAAKKLELMTTECIAFEDSPNGVKSASAAKCYTIMVPDLDTPDDECSALCEMVCKTLNEAADRLGL